MATATAIAGSQQVPDGWQLVSLGELADINRSSWDPSKGSSILYLDLTAVSAPGVLSAPREIDTSEAPSRARRRVNSGDILISTVRPNLRGFARVTDAPINLIASTGFAVVTAKGNVDASFLYHHVMTPQFADFLEAATTGQAYPAVRPLDVAAYSLPVPPLPEQRAIAAVLDSIDDAIEGAEAVIAATEQLRDSLLHDMLTRGLPGQHTEWRDVSGLGTIPADWEVVRLGDVIGVGPTNGIYKPDSEYGNGVCLIRIDDFAFGEFGNFGDFKRIRATEEEIGRYEVRKDDIVINRVNSLSHIGKSVLIPQVNEPTLFESNMMRIRFDRCTEPRFGALVLLSDTTRRYFKSRAKKAVQQASINQQDVSELPFPLPPTTEQQMIAGLLAEVDMTLEQVRSERRGVQLLKESTAAALLTGRVRNK